MLDKVAKSKHMSDKISHRVHPKPEVDMSDTKQARDAIYDWCLSEYHPCGSLAMGDAVDSKLKVKGVKNLRVVDASVFPNHVGLSLLPRWRTADVLLGFRSTLR